MELRIRSKAKRYAKVITFIPLALAVVLGCIWWISHHAAGYSAIFGGIALTPIVWLVLNAIVKELDGVEWVVSSSGIVIRKNGGEERNTPWDTIAKVEMAGAGINLHMKPKPAETAEEGKSKEEAKPKKRAKKDPPLEEVRIGFVDHADAAIVAACHQKPSLLDDEGKDDEAPIMVGPSSGQKVTKAFATVVCLALGAYAGVRGISAVRAHLQTNSWPTTKADITKSEIGEDKYDESKRVIKKLDIEYTYAVEGEQFTSKRATAWSKDLAGFEDIANDYVKRYPAKDEVDVYYDPANPKYAVITPGADSVVSTAGIIVGLPLFVIGVLLGISLLKAGFVPTRENIKNHLESQPA